MIKFEGIGTFIFRKLKSKKFRKTKIDPSSEEVVKKAIRLNVEKNEPIKFTYPFGGYKIWRLPSYPEVDWAEFMAIAHIIQYVAPIAAAYEPGVEVFFCADDIIIEKIDNSPREKLDAYLSSFNKLLEEFSKYLPNNLKLTLFRAADLFTPDEYEAELNKARDGLLAKGISPERMVEVKRLSEFNFVTKGRVDYSKLSKVEREKMFEELAYFGESYLSIPKRRAFNRAENKIVIFSNPLPNALDIGSTKTSKAKFWAGTGVLECEDEKYYDRIITPKQWEETKDEAKEVPVSLIPMMNFKKVLVFQRRLNFLSDKTDD
ncbi:MAG: hypothetical protein UW86_C0003G0002 [Microgenomates group bacterium GW2011_GWA1_Microgenomates_45_10]|nr:MAG: hypothetical protein UW69_C0027G0002 [Microgenomates group bacterium GW2011_GWA2_44_7]KKT77634.1 MAG: hypothetical protein UW73_C0015G0002 [Microgenomates group bacterium GW2011_GWB1_44_8]KKT87357.1 MAG: hypothetical protein UW86_C0003G0002 [Microgenomates group bacterium GW2011_GWA1_Microgenomates_45_10]